MSQLPKSSLEQLTEDVTTLKLILLKFMTSVEGDDYTYGITKKINDQIKRINNNPANEDINPEHFKKLLDNIDIVKNNISSLSEFMSLFSIRYSSDKCNKRVIDRMLKDFTLLSNKDYYKLPGITKKGDNNDTVSTHKDTKYY